MQKVFAELTENNEFVSKERAVESLWMPFGFVIYFYVHFITSVKLPYKTKKIFNK